MRYILLFWAAPMGLFWGWYYLSYNDMHFGFLFLSRLVHDYTFNLYANLLGIEADAIPAMIARACVIDTAIIFAILAFRRRKRIAAWWTARQAAYRGDARNALSRSSAP